MKNKLITDPNRINELSQEKKCVWIKRHQTWQFLPASFVRNWQFWRLINLINDKKVFEDPRDDLKNIKGDN